MLDSIIVFFDGKKTYINSIALILVPYLVATDVISAELGAVITGIIGILTGSGKYISDQAIKNDTTLGQSIINKRAK